MTIPIEQFGRDHWSTLAYFETLATDNAGRVDHRRMRCDAARHFDRAHLPYGVGGRCPTRLKDGSEVEDHDDWDCMDDLAAAGLVNILKSGCESVIEMTPLGWQLASALRRHRAESKQHASAYQTFDLYQVSSHGAGDRNH